MNEKAEFAERLRNAMTAAGYPARPAVLEREFNSRYRGRSVTFQAVSRWLRGQSIPSQEKLLVLAEWLRIEPQALRYGDKAVRHIREQRARWEDAGLYQERATFEAYLSLPPAQRKIVREVIMAFAQAVRSETPKGD
ncbi:MULTISPECIES: transcriptional regulator [unclassified Pseudomonas]|uniref:transcriptional regulator n=1 Tax=unclassified Pseudomonas TaxID=196821 RepID=UPI00244D1C86|nr:MULTISPECIES: transcriptional regulator [unclassified Pseudomonas]MDH0893516.1 transcriptional regulator [Pseudomonas sp. GD03875]MDH1066905.1 transcriptional regulator [Pseudomonas sp. GD03985]